MLQDEDVSSWTLTLACCPDTFMMILYSSGTQDQIKIFHKLIWSLLFIKETEKALIYIYNFLHLEKFIYVTEE